MRHSGYWAILIAVIGTGTLDAQTVAGSGQVFPVQYRVEYLGAVYQQTGIWIGGAGEGRVGPVGLELSGLTGKLTGGGTPDVTVRTTAVRLQVAAAPWLAIGAKVEGRHFESAVGENAWRLIGPAIRLTPSFGSSGLAALVDASVFLSTTTTAGLKMSPAMQLVTGVSWQSARSPLTLGLAYRFERFDMDDAGTPRLEQFQGLVASAGVRLGRR